MRVELVSAELLTGLSDGPCPVHSRFEAGFNLRVGTYLTFVGNKLGEKLPFSLLLAPSSVAEIPETVRPGETVFFWNRRNQRLETEGFSLELAGAQRFRSSPDVHCALSQADLARFDQVAPLEQQTGLGVPVRALSDLENPEIQALCRCFQHGNREEIQAVLGHWVGRGPGLTPSGDDFLTAILFIDCICPFLSAAFCAALAALAEDGYTTDVSVNYYRCALRGLFSGALNQFAHALSGGDSNELGESVRKILQFGHTSGRDMLAGLRLGLAYLSNTLGVTA